MKKIIAIVAFTVAAGLLFSGCSGGGSSSTTASGVSLSMPSNISPVPTTATGVASSHMAKHVSLGSLFAGVAATDAGTDYSNASTSKHVEEHVLSQFQIINTILDAMSQTHFSDSANIGKGPYKVLVAWQDSGGGNQQGAQTKQLQTWVVDSSLIVENGQNVNQFLAWIQSDQNGTPTVITVKVKIHASPTLKTDGSYQDYGIWTLNATFGGNTSKYFAASAAVGPSGEAIIKFHDATQGGASNEVKAILNTSNGSGYGKIIFPEFSNCNSNPCIGTPVSASYVYDASSVGIVTTSGSGSTTFKDRTATTDVTTYYGLYDSVTGVDVLKTKTFGFPVKYTDSNQVEQMAYYGSWQGRHSLWTNGSTVPPGTTLTRMDLGANQTETYTVTSSSNFSGSLTKRTLVASDINNILNLPVSTWTNMSTSMVYTGTTWCNTYPGTNNCSAITDLSSLVADPNNPNQFISINGTLGMTSGNFVYDPSGSSGAGFYGATNSNGTWTTNGILATPSINDTLWVNIGGSIYIEYTDKPTANGYQSGQPVWVKKKMTAFDQQTWTPTFDDSLDTAYTLGSNQQYYLMNQGTNFVLTTGSNTTFQIEVQTVANPINATSFTGSGTIFAPQWSNGYATNYTFVTDSSDPRYLNLVYNTVDSNDQNLVTANVHSGDIVLTGIYGLVANDGTQYNWDYATSQNPYGLLTYLVGPSPSSSYKLLDDPIALLSFQVTDIHGLNPINVSPMYSGWMSGVPDIYNDLRMTDWIMTADIQSKVYNIPSGTLVTDAHNVNQQYLIKPLNISEFLDLLGSNPGLDLSLADSADLSTVPTLVDPQMGSMPNITVIKYSEGNLVQ